MAAPVTSMPTASESIPAPPRFMLVPGLVGLPLDDAEATLAGRGLTVGAVQGGSSSCLDADVVLAQRPAIDVRLSPGSSVDLTVNRPEGACGDRPPPAPADLRRIAQRFLQFAQGDAAYPPADTPINLYLGGIHTETISSSRLGDHAAWRTCPRSGAYAGATCPFSAVDLLRTHPGRLAITIQHPTHPCARPTRIPGMGRSVTLTPRESQDCTSYFAVELFVNEVGQVTDVDLVRTEP